MDVTGKSGFSVTELLVVVLILGVLSVVMFPAGRHPDVPNMAAVGMRGKDIYVSIIRANTDRALQGLSPVWPADDGEFDFPNSTEYFRHLYDEAHVGTEAWKPILPEFDYSKLAGAKVPQCDGKPLTADCNMWTVAKNVRDDMEDVLPVLITRNVDAASLASEETSWELERKPGFDNDWYTPFSRRGFVMIRKSGAVFKARSKYATYQSVYQRPSTRPLENVDEAAQTGLWQQPDTPLKYLTPTREVIPGDAAYAGCRKRLHALRWTMKHTKQELEILRDTIVPTAIGWAVMYFAFLIIRCVERWKARQHPVLPSQLVVVGLFQYCAVVLYSMLMSGLGLSVLALAVAVQIAGVICISWVYRNDRDAHRDGLKWVLAPGAAAVAVFLLGFVWLRFS